MKNLYVIKKTALLKNGTIWHPVFSLTEKGTPTSKTGRLFTLNKRPFGKTKNLHHDYHIGRKKEEINNVYLWTESNKRNK
jgi:hypothetical protein